MNTLIIPIDKLIASWPWYLARSAGFLAIILLITLMISGIGHVTGWTYKVIEPVKAWFLHKWISYCLIAVTLIHIVALLFDKYIKFSVADILVPFANFYSNKSTFFGIPLGWIAIPAGILSLYGIIFIVVVSLRLANKKRTWKFTHIISYLVAALVFIHALGAGTDLDSGILRWITMAVFLVLITATGFRLFHQSKLT